MAASRTRRRFALAGLLAFSALNAFGGGWFGLAGADGVPMAWLDGSPFTSYFVPSLVLFVVVGGTTLTASVLVFTRSRYARVSAIGAGLVMLGWIVVQLVIIGFVSWLQPAVAVASLVVLALTTSALPAPPEPRGRP